MRAALPLLAALLLAAGSASAQKATFEARSLTPEAALTAASAALQHCRSRGWQAAVAVTDRAAVPLVVLRDRHAGPHTPQLAADKAYTALTFKTDTVALEALTRTEPAMGGLRQVPRAVLIGGGIPIASAGSQVGAIGVSGAPGGAADEECAKAGIRAIADDLEF
jgi:uncharacterized protein GlcG (DUF336 family)